MHTIYLLFIAIGLAMDAFAVSISSGIVIKRLHIRHALKIAFYFGGFQALMPVLGWLTGRGSRSFIEDIDHFVAAAILFFIGGKMMYESREVGEEKGVEDIRHRTLLILAIATSIDAFGVGLTISLIGEGIFFSALIIGLVSFLLSFIGVYIGDHFGHFMEERMEVMGGVILILIGLHILYTHML